MRALRLTKQSIKNQSPRTSTLAAVFFLLAVVAVQVSATCSLEKDERNWIGSSLLTWKKIRSEQFKLGSAPTPWLLLFDRRCVFHINPEPSLVETIEQPRSLKLSREKMTFLAVEHAGSVQLPEKGEVPAQLLSFAAPYGNGRSSFVVFALPEFWQAAPHLANANNIDVLTVSVFVHEMTHTMHRGYYAKLDEIENRMGASIQIDDDIVQNTFAGNDEFSSSVNAEIKLLYEAARARDRSAGGSLARNALKRIKVRRSKYFNGDKAVFAELEDIFLSMEGAANWAAYRAASAKGLSEEQAIQLIRRGGKYWSQDLGLAIYLVIARLLPEWEAKAFGVRPSSALELLSEAVKNPN